MIIKSNLVPKPFYAFTAWPFIVVKPEHADNVALIAHEMVHYKEQAWITPIWWLRYALSKTFRIAAEVKAYKVQIIMGDMTPAQAAGWLMKYDSSLTIEAATELLSLS
jgi:hypothetical protein